MMGEKILAMVLSAAVVSLLAVDAAKAEYQEITVKDGGKITGTITFKGPLPEHTVDRYPVSGKWPGCGTGFRDVVRVDVKNGALRGCFVLLDGVTKGKKWPKPETPPMIDQKDCKFLPPLQIVRSGTSMIIRNSDNDVLHNINVKEEVMTSSGRSLERMMFNIAQPFPVDIKKKVNPQSTPYLTVGCEIHNWMSAYMLATEHPYAAIVKDDGSYVIDDVPPGQYAVIVWHPTLGRKKTTVTVTANSSAEANFAFSK